MDLFRGLLVSSCCGCDIHRKGMRESNLPRFTQITADKELLDLCFLSAVIWMNLGKFDSLLSFLVV